MRKSKKVWNWFSRVRLRYKLFLMYCLMIIIPLLIAGIYLNSESQSIMINQAVRETNANMDRIENRINHVFEHVAYISELARADENLHILAKHEFQSNLDVFQMNRAYSLFEDFAHPHFDNFVPRYDEIFDMRFYTFNPTALNAGQAFRLTDEIRNTHWFETAVANEGRIVWLFKEDELSLTRREHFILTRLIVDSETDDHLGILNIYISNNSLLDVFQDEADESVLLLNYEVVVFYENKILVAGNGFTNQLMESANGVEGLMDYLEADESIKINARNVELRGFMDNEIQIVSIISIDQVTAQVNLLMQRVFLVVGACLLLSATLILVFIKRFHDRVNAVKGAMNQVAKGNFNIASTIESKDEIGEIYEQLYETMIAMQQLMQENFTQRVQTEQWKVKQKESEFKRLTSQINPHFIYNTLEMIRVGVLKSGAADIAQIVSLLGKLLRRSLETHEKFIPLEQEIEFIRMYLQIQQLRFKDKMKYDIQINVKGSYKIMPLLIQPIVENAFIHGVEMKGEESQISISIYEKEDLLIVEVEDNGVGIPTARLAELKKMLETQQDNDFDSIGLKNVEQRVKLYYGESYGILLESEENIRTKVSLHLPRE